MLWGVHQPAPTLLGTWNARRRRSRTYLVYQVRQASSYSAIGIPNCTSTCWTCLRRSRKCGAWGTLHPALTIAHCVSFTMATPSFLPFLTRSAPPFTFHPPPVRVSFLKMYRLGVLLLGLLLIRGSRPCAVVSCGARLSPRKHPCWIIVWHGTMARSPHRNSNPQGLPKQQHQRMGNGPVWQRSQRHGGCNALDVCLSARAPPTQLSRRTRRTFANFIWDPCVATIAYNRLKDNPLSRDNPQ